MCERSRARPEGECAHHHHDRRQFLNVIARAGAIGAGSALLGVLPSPALRASQRRWRYCGKRQSMLFDGYPDKGLCPAGGSHAQGYAFDLTYNVGESPTAQGAWRYCAGVT
jgi:hypothetical protein